MHSIKNSSVEEAKVPAIYGTKYSRADQAIFVEDSL